MAKTKKPSDESPRAEAQSRMAEIPEVAVGGRLDDTADMDDLDMPDEVERAMQEQMSKQRNIGPER